MERPGWSVDARVGSNSANSSWLTDFKVKEFKFMCFIMKFYFLFTPSSSF